MAHAAARVTVQVRLDASEHYRHNGDTGPFLVEQVRAWSFPPVGSNDDFTLKGTAIKKDGTAALFHRTGSCRWADLPTFIQNVILDEVASTADTVGSWELVG